MTANEKYPIRCCVILTSPIQMQLSLKPKTFIHSLVPYLESTSNFKHFEKEMIVIGALFWKLQTMKDLDRSLSKNTVSQHPLTVNVLNGAKLS